MKQKSVMFIFVIFILAYNSAYALKFVMMGDSRDNMSTFATAIGIAGKENPELILHDGDCWGNASSSSWVSAIQRNTVTKALLDANKYLVSCGNHETFSALNAISPSVVRNKSETYSFTEGNCFFACGGYSNASYIVGQFKTEAAQAARWRFGWQHVPVYGTGSHPANGNATMENGCDAAKATLILSGHNHNYERTYLMYKQAVVNTPANVYNLNVTPGTIYLTNGLSGAPVYSVTKKSWGAVQINTSPLITIVEAGNDTCVFTTKNSSGTVVDKFIIIVNATKIVSATQDKTWHTAVLRSLGNNSFVLSGPVGAPYTIMGLSGRIETSGKMFSPEQQLNLSGMHKGIYIVKINSFVKKVQVVK